ncbi:MAG TPA: PQQ-binding-like beta-propeller repeat protein [Planctomycetota bacterium]|nr:PQQ-binding-like beta-propeller repeat protein [Planctomycetota bacterium]
MLALHRTHLGAWLAFAPLATTAASAQQRAPEVVPTVPAVAWHAPGRSMEVRRPLACSKGRVFRGGDTLEALDVHTGERAVAAKAAGPWLEPVLGGGFVFARHRDGSVHAFVPNLDRELWQVPLAPSWFPGSTCGDIFLVASGTEVVAITAGGVHWRTDLGESIEMTPAADGKRVFVGTAAGRVVALDLHTGAVAWERDVGGELGHSDPVVDRDTLFVADRGQREGRRGSLNALSAATGELLWQTSFGATGFSTPFPCEDEVWAGFGTTVVRFDRATGRLDRDRRICAGRNPFGRPAVAGDAVVFGNLDGSLYVHDRASGARRWRFEVGKDAQVGSWCLHEGVLVVSTTVGLFGLVASTAKPEADFVLRAEVTNTK